MQTQGFGEPIAMEGALKLKEIGYLHAEGYSGGALKHGPFAMIESDENGKNGATPIVSFHYYQFILCSVYLLLIRCIHLRLCWCWMTTMLTTCALLVKRLRQEVPS